MYAFEAFSVNFSTLRSNIENNAIANVHSIQLVVSDKSGRLEFFVNKCHTRYNSISYKNAFDYLKTNHDVQSV